MSRNNLKVKNGSAKRKMAPLSPKNYEKKRPKKAIKKEIGGNMQNLKEEYLNLSYRLIRLFEVRKKTTKALFDEEFSRRWSEEKSSERQKQNKRRLAQLNKMIKKTEKRLSEIIKKAEESKIALPFEELTREYALPKEAKYILMAIFFSEIEARSKRKIGFYLLNLLGYKPAEIVKGCELLQNLMKEDLIMPADLYLPPAATILSIEYSLTPKAMRIITDSRASLFTDPLDEILGEEFPGRRRRERENILIIREPLITFDQIVLKEEKRQAIERACFQIEKGNSLLTEWGFDQTIKYGKGMIILFYGPPGTGKTATSEAIAHRLGKKIGMTSYARIYDKWVGDSEKNLIRIFEEAKREDCLLLFDEADALFAKRLNETYSTDRMHNLMTNILMQELERFEGVCILTTNREVAMDEAFGRRLLLKLKFDIPESEERAKIWRKLIPEKAPIASDVNFEELGRRFELTGGEIKNAVLNAVQECAYRGEEEITMAILIQFAEKELANAGREKKNKLGFTV
jgi:AAA+ superfamily predicted ATPase